MPQPIEPVEIPVATHIQIDSFEINVEDLIGTIRYTEGTSDEEGYKPFRQMVHHIDSPKMTQIMSTFGDPEVTLYDQIKKTLYETIPHSLIEEPNEPEEVEVPEESGES